MLSVLCPLRPHLSLYFPAPANYWSGPRTLIRVPFAFCPRYPGSSSILVPVGSFGVSLYTPGAKRPNKIAVSQSSGRPPHVTDRRIFIRRYYSAGYFVALTRPH